MKAIILKDFGGVENLVLAEIPVPAIGAHEVLIKVKAISINPVDVKTRAGGAIAGLIRDESPLILGWDLSGEIMETGSQVTGFRTGDEAFGMIAFPETGKTYAEYVKVKPGDIGRKPGNISHEEAAAASMAALTAWQVFDKFAPIRPGDRVLIHAASGGVGHYAVQMAKHLGAYVIGISSAANREFVLSLGADEHIDYQTQAFETFTDNIDFVFDSLGTETVERSLQVMKKGGTIVSILSGVNDHVLRNAAPLYIKGHNLLAVPSTQDMESIAGLLEKGIIRSHISKTYLIEQMAEAHLQLESGKTVGKVVLTF